MCEWLPQRPGHSTLKGGLHSLGFFGSGGLTGRPDYPEFTAFLATQLGKSATDEEVAILRSMVFGAGRPTGNVYQAMLIALRGSR